MRLLALFALPLCLFSQSLWAAMTAEEYGYPLLNPFEATIASTPAQLRPILPLEDSVRQSDYRIDITPERTYPLPSIFWAVDRFGYRLAKQSGEAPLLVVIAGTGSNFTAGTANDLKRLFYANGYHVLVLSSPTSYDFISSASRYATPGLSSEDAKDLMRALKAIQQQHPSLKVSSYHLAGYSLGALNAAFLAELDSREPHFNFQRVLLINPPVNLYTSVANLDRLVQAQIKEVDANTTFFELLIAKFSRYFQAHGYIDMSEAMLFDFQQSPERLTNEEMAMLIGAVFRFAAADIVFTSDLINKRGLITPSSVTLHQSTPLEPYFKRAMQCDFECYMQEQLYPLWEQLNPGGDLDDMIFDVSLYRIESFLKNNQQLIVLHNADDPILGQGDLGFLRRTLGERLLLFPHGGHLGNINYRVNTQAMLEFFRD